MRQTQTYVIMPTALQLCTTPLLNSLELPGGTIKENRGNFVVYAGIFPAVIFLHRVNLDEQNQSLKKKSTCQDPARLINK